MITADELYKKLLEKKQRENRTRLDSMDLLWFGNVENQMAELENEGKIKRYDDVTSSFEVF